MTESNEFKTASSEETNELEEIEEDKTEDSNDDLDEDDNIIEEEKQPFSPDSEPLSEEELDTVADTAIETIRSIISFFGAEDAVIDEYEGDEGELQLDIVGGDLAVLIGRHGRTLDALQFIVTSSVNRKLGYRYPIIVDIEGYKYRRRQKIEGVATNAASRAARQNQSISLKPMTPYERRIVHLILRDDNRVITVSEGEDPNRYVVIKPKRL